MANDHPQSEHPQPERPQSESGSTAFLLAQVGAYAAEEFGSLLAPLKLTPADAGILRFLRQCPGISQQKLAGALGMHASRLVALIDGLEKRGLVVREANADDRRVYSLRLTDAGAEMLQSIGQAARSHNERLCASLSAEERIQLNSLLRRIAAEHGLAAGVHPGYKAL
jgi:DNA-binding MarR family transcriptional regulator